MKHKFSLSILTLLIAAFIISCPLVAQSSGLHLNKVTGGGIGIGSVIAIVASWTRNKSVLWAIFHAICSWFYVVYYIFTR